MRDLLGARQRRAWRLGWRGLLGAALIAPALALAPGAVAQADGTCTTSNGQVTCIFGYTGAAQTWTVPAWVTQATFTLYGAQGGPGGGGGPNPGGNGAGGLGGEATATLPVIPGASYVLYVGGAGAGGNAILTETCEYENLPGGAGGYHGGGAGGASGPTNCGYPTSGGGGGGSSAVVDGSNTSLVLLEAGGGGGGGGSGDERSGGGGGGTQSAGGAGGVAAGFPSICLPGTQGANGVAGVGGAGGTMSPSGCFGQDTGGSGGAGGGSTGGNGTAATGSAAGGGGGSGYGPAGAVFQSGVAAPDGAPNGEIVITYSMLASVTTVDLAPGSSLVYGQPLSFSAKVLPTGSTTLPTGTVQFQIDGANFGAPVAIVGDSATSPATSALSAGAHTITAVYSGDGNFASSTGTLAETIAKAPLTVAADNKAVAYGQAIPTLTYTPSGFVNGDTSSVLSGAPALSTPAMPTSAPGQYPISIGQGTLAAANYTFRFQGGTLTITKASQTISFPALSGTGTVAFGASPLALGATATSGLPVSYTTTGPCTVAGATLTLTGVGACTVTAQQGGNADYLAAPDVRQTLTITQPADTTPPTASPTQSPPANAAGWNNANVTVDWNWADDTGGSGIDPSNCTTSSISSGEGVITLSATCDDKAGNVGKASYTVKVDATAPVGSVSVVAGPPTQATATLQDATSGLASIQVTEANNATYSIPAFTPGTTQPVQVVFTKTDQSQGAAFGLTATDIAGNSVTIDPADVSLDRSTGKPHPITITGIQGYERTLTIQNGTPGVQHLAIAVNGQQFAAEALADGQTTTLDIGAALHPGADNSVTLTPRGKPGGSAEVVVSGSTTP